MMKIVVRGTAPRELEREARANGFASIEDYFLDMLWNLPAMPEDAPAADESKAPPGQHRQGTMEAGDDQISKD